MFELTTHTWPAGSTVKLCRVPWDSTYKDVVEFENEKARGDYFFSLASNSITLEKMSYCKFGQPIKVNIPFHEAYTYNYLTVTNKTEKGKERTFYYFINDVSFSAPDTSILLVQLDVFQSYLFDFKIGQMFVERSHVNMPKISFYPWLDSEFTNKAQRYLTAPEGLNIGTDYRVSDHDLINLSLNNFKVIICSTVDLVADWGTLSNPNLKTADGQETDRIISGCNVYQIDLAQFENFMDKVSNAPWIASGIISINLFPTALLTDGPTCKLGGVDAMFLGETPDEGEYFREFKEATTRVSNALPAKYRMLSKFYTYPYSVIEVNNFSGSSLMLKPEMLKGNDLRLKNISCATPGHQRIGFYVSNYGISENAGNYQPQDIINDYIDGTNQTRRSIIQPGTNHDLTIWLDSLPQLSLVKDNYLQWIAQTQNSREYSYQSAGWSNEKANISAQTNYNQTQQAMATASQNQLLGMAITGLNAGTNTAMGALAGGTPGALVGAGLGVAGMVGSYASFQNTQALQQDIASQNYSLAQWANAGDYQQAIAGINANVQDMALTQPSQVAQSGGNGFNVSNGLFALEVRFKTLGQNQISIIGDFWTRYGYAVKEYLQNVTKLQVMKRFTYWKCQEVYLDCAKATESAKDTIRGIFTRGTTVWGNPNDIGNCDIYDNYEM